MFKKLPDAASADLTIFIDGTPVAATVGESVAAALLRQAEPWSRLTPVSSSRRGPYCMMGVCFDCLAEVDGTASVQTCLLSVREGMHVSRQKDCRRIEPSHE